MSEIRLYLFGSPRLERDGVPVKLDTRKALALLIYLIVTKKTYRRDSLVALLWAESNQSSGRARLRDSIYRIHKALLMPIFRTDRETVSINRDATLWCDAEAFLELADHNLPENKQQLVDAVELYQEGFLAGFEIADSEEFGYWQQLQYRFLESRMIHSLKILIDILEKAGDFEGAIPYANRWLEIDKFDEQAHTELIRLYANSGQKHAALQEYECYEKLLRDEIGGAPDNGTRALYKSIIESGSYKTENAEVSNNLPRQIDTFIGRSREKKEITDILASTRLVTLSGAGGCGKTQLATHTARGIARQFKNGIWFVDLASLANAEHAGRHIASTIGVHEESDRSLTESIIAYFEPKRSLIILDNCEHMTGSCADLVNKLLSSCGNLKILVTSREPLNIKGETIWRVPPLSYPAAGSIASTEAGALLNYESIQLFIERLKASGANARVNNATLKTIAHICCRLEGIPLAIELAAANVRILSLEQIHARLPEGFGSLGGGMINAEPRHRTLRDTLDWSFSLLSPEEKQLLLSVSVFVGGFLQEAAEAIAANCQKTHVLNLLRRLVDKSLITLEISEGRGRYRLLEITRQYALEKLLAAGDLETARNKQADFEIEYAEEIETSLYGPRQLELLTEMDKEYANIRYVLDYLLRQSDGARGVQLAGSLAYYWWRRGLFAEGIEWFSLFDSLSDPPVYNSRYARLKFWIGWMFFITRDLTSSLRCLEEGFEVAKSTGDTGIMALTLSSLAGAERVFGNIDIGTEHAKESLELARKSGDPWVIAFALKQAYATVPMRDVNVEFCASALEEAITLAKKTGDPFLICNAIHSMGDVFLFAKDYKTGRPWYQQSLEMAGQIDDTFIAVQTYIEMGSCFFHSDELDEAKQCYKDALTLAHEIGASRLISDCIQLLGKTAKSEGNLVRSARLYAIAETKKASTEAGAAFSQMKYRSYLEKELGTERFAEELAWCCRLTNEEAIRFALDVPE